MSESTMGLAGVLDSIVTEKKDDHLKAYINLGIAYFKLRNFEESINMFNKAIEIKNDYPEAYYKKGVVLYYINKRNKACSEWKKANELGHEGAASKLQEYCK